MPKEKAPGPNGYIGTFLCKCWNIIKQDWMEAMQQFFNMNQQGLHYLKQTYVVLISKKKMRRWS